MSEPIGFTVLAERLVRHARERVRRGDFSEAALAGLVGYSQPHIHNVLKGKRGLSFALADDLLALSGIPLAALLSAQEASGQRPPSDSAPLSAVLLRGHLGAGAPYPSFPRLAHKMIVTIPSQFGVINPLALQISPNETSMSPLVQPRDTVILDTSPNERRRPNPASIYALCWEDRGYLGRCCLRAGRLEISLDQPESRGRLPSSVSLHDGARLLDVVRGKVVWLSREMRSESRRPRP